MCGPNVVNERLIKVEMGVGRVDEEFEGLGYGLGPSKAYWARGLFGVGQRSFFRRGYGRATTPFLLLRKRGQLARPGRVCEWT